METQSLLRRLDDIGHSLERSGHALALIGLGSVGLERDRLDAYSDLDFFVIVEEGYKERYLGSPDWLSDVHPIAYSFSNTVDGYKTLFADGIFCEFAVFEINELRNIPFAPGRLVWKRPEIPETISQPIFRSGSQPKRDHTWLLGEALTNLFIGIKREKRGERLSAMRFIQGYAVEHVLELIEAIETTTAARRDPFARERRFEQRFPGFVSALNTWMQGYEKNLPSALAILTFLESHFEVDPAMANAIRKEARLDTTK